MRKILPKPKHLSFEYAAQFKDRSVVEVYYYRPPYPSEVFEALSNLTIDQPRTVLDAGCGIGDIARGLVDFVDRIDAVDFSPGMIEKGKRLPNGDHPNLNWICGPVEEVPFQPPYALITAGDSLHWMEWDLVLPRFKEMLTLRGYVAIINRHFGIDSQEEISLIRRYSTNQDYQPYNLVEELELRGLFQKRGETQTQFVPWRASINEYIEARHSQNGLSRDRMGKERAAAFDEELRGLLLRFCGEGKLELQVYAKIIWGIAIN